MPDYWDAKDAVIDFLDLHAEGKSVRKNYLHPPSKPKFNAATKLEDLGLGGSAMTARRDALNESMRKQFGALWANNIGVISIKAVATIGDLIKLVTSRLKFGLPDKEPT
jgi:hypothetical protein